MKDKDLLPPETPPEETEPTLSAEELTFARLVAKGVSGTTAYKRAFPEKKHLTYDTRRVYASKLLAKHDISTEVQTSKIRQARLARLAEERLEQILITDNSSDKGSKVAEVGMFMYEQANGKAVQKLEHKGVFVSVNYNLAGGEAGEVPQEVLDQLAED